jgi:hypothetical protein
VLTAICLLLAASPTPPDTVIVCQKEFLAEITPWISYRESQGHSIEILSNTRSREELRKAIRELAKSGSLRFLVLIGDSDPRAETDPVIRTVSVPAHRATAKVNIKWGSEPEIGTDNWFADLNDDQIPELSVGRLPADNGAELALMVRKILDYERNADFGAWRRRVNFVAGVGGFGALADSVLESATKRFLTDGIPPAFQTSMTYGSWRSAYCPDPRRFHEMALERFNEGCLFWVYIGHGQRTYLDRIYVPGNAYHILDVNDVSKLDHGGRPPIAVFLSCYAGAFDGPNDCLAEKMVAAPRGPVAALCGSRVTMPYAMAVMGSELLKDVFAGQTATIGEMLLHAKQKMMESPPADSAGNESRQLLDALAKAISPAPELLDEERREHLQLFNLLGDPLLRLPRPHAMRVEIPSDLRAGDVAKVKLSSEVEGSCTIDLVCRRDRLRTTAPSREYYDGRDRILREYQDVYQMANDAAWYVQTVTCRAGDTDFEFTVPPEARGQCHVRAFISGNKHSALGSADVFVRKPTKAIAGK